MIGNIFDIAHESADGKARSGTLHLPHGDVSTPVFMPVGTSATVKALTKDDLDEIGFEIILANTYHLYLRPGSGVIEKAGGLHGFSGWRKNFLTDSGGFQVWSLSKLRKITEEGVLFASNIDGSRHLFTPEKVVDIQCALNSDIQMQLDVCTGFGVTRAEAEDALEVTGRWLVRAKEEWLRKLDAGYKGILLPIVQGNFFEDLRERSAEFVSGMNLPAVAIGGLSVGEPPDLFSSMLEHTVGFLPKEKARYVMGIGTPDYILDAVRSGVDMFDCVLPTRNARNGSYFTRDGNLPIKQARFADDLSPLDSGCGCKVCRSYPRAYLHHLFKEQEILSSMLASYHNLYFLRDMMREIRNAIEENRFERYRTDFLGRYRSDKWKIKGP